MNKASNLLIGPELVWVFAYIVIILIIKLTNSPIKSMDDFWVSTSWWIPLIFIVMIFSVYFIPGSVHKWMILRLWIVGLIGGGFLLSKSLGAHSEQGPGVGTAWIMGIIIAT